MILDSTTDIKMDEVNICKTSDTARHLEVYNYLDACPPLKVNALESQEV